MHVLWVNQAARFAGGAEAYVAAAASELRARGVRSTLLYGVEGWTDPGFTRLFDGAFPLVEPARQVADLGPDIIYVHQLHGVAPLRALAGLGVPVTRFLHDHRIFCPRESKYTVIGQHTCRRTVGPACYPCLGVINRADGWPGLRLRTLSAVRAEQRANKDLDALIVGSGYMKDHAEAHGFDGDRIHVIPPGVRGPMSEEPVHRSSRQLLFVGGLLRGKGLDVLLEAVARLAEGVRLEVVGSGRQEVELRELAGRLRLFDRVSFVGRLGREALSRAYRRATCVVVPSRSPETFGLVGAEALAHGTPVIASDVGGVGEWLQDGRTGLAVPSGDPDALAVAIERALAYPEALARMGEKGQQLCSRRFAPEVHGERLLALLRSVGGGGRS